MPRAASRLPVPVAGCRSSACTRHGVRVGQPAQVDLAGSPVPGSASAPVAGSAFVAMNRFTWSGVRVGYFCRISATVPEVIAAAWLVPQPRK